MKMVSTDKVLNVKAMNHDLKIISIMLNCRWQGNETMCRALIKNRVCMCVVYQRVSPSPTLPLSCRFVSFSVRVCACVRSRVRCWSRAYPHRHDGVGVGWSGCRMATYGTKLHAYTETEFLLSLLWDSDASSFSFRYGVRSSLVVLSLRPTPYGKVGLGVGSE
jgi:hypothetical protein